ncbi:MULTISPECIES: cysteine hydrolase family protein [unclassified Variovorax]|uniref:cysteine hydrolase family protein n=1 Tax=unclassified Variovorax TaxID=663243 RepID=UPI00131759ED|nr:MULTISPECIES: isochorismatase family cysteine hydrolase [unclassified Variovorax]VTU45428.1 Isochorismatase family protein YecD [Variovorax sp. PBL-E5]VTU46448.1 Isochorismatase family protein YecD [Variovorax sp. SRS16]
MKSIYLVLDMQNDLVHADGPNGKSPMGEQVRARQVVANTAAALRKARDAGIAVGFVRVGFSADYHECPKSSPVFGAAAKAGIYKLGTWGTEIHPDLAEQPGDVQVVKHRVSPFYSTTLMAQLRAAGIERIYCSGVSTQAVVQATVRDAHDRDFDVVVIEDGCCAHSEEEHRNSMGSIARFCRVVNSGTVDFKS